MADDAPGPDRDGNRGDGPPQWDRPSDRPHPSTMAPGDRPIWYRIAVNADEGRLRGGWRLVLGVVAFVAALVFGGLLAFLIAGIVPATIPPWFHAPIWYNLALVGALVALAIGVDRRSSPVIGLGGTAWWPNLAFGIVLGIVMTTAVFAVELGAGLLVVEEVFVTRPIGGGAALPFVPAIAITVVLFVAVATGEELFARGYLMTNLAESMNGLGPIGPRGAIATAGVLTSGLFGALHLSNPNATVVSSLYISLVGLYFAAAYVVTDDLGVPIGVHFSWNFSLASIYGFPVSGIDLPASVLAVRQTGDPLITGGRFGPEAGLVLFVALALAVAATWLWVRWREGNVRFRTDVATYEPREEPANHEG